MAASRKVNKYKAAAFPEPTPVPVEVSRSSSKTNEEALMRYMQEFCAARTRHVEGTRANTLRQVFQLMYVQEDGWSPDTFDTLGTLILPDAVFEGAPLFSKCKEVFDRSVVSCTEALATITDLAKSESEFARACPVLAPYYDHRFLWSMECDAFCEMLADSLLVKKEPYTPLLDSGAQITWVAVLMHLYGPTDVFWVNTHLPSFGYAPLVMKS